MVTPFRADGSINFDVAIELATKLVSEGSDGLVIAGSTGEGSSLSDKEKLELFACVAGAVEVPVLAGSTFADTARSVELTRQVLETGVTGVLATTPAYARPSQKGIAAHFAAIAECHGTPRHALRHPGSHRTKDRRVDDHRPRVVALEHRGHEGRLGRPRERRALQVRAR